MEIRSLLGGGGVVLGNPPSMLGSSLKLGRFGDLCCPNLVNRVLVDIIT